MGGLYSPFGIDERDRNRPAQMHEEAVIEYEDQVENVWPITLEQLKRGLGISTLQTEDDDDLKLSIAAATRALEKFTSKRFLPATFEQLQTLIAGQTYIGNGGELRIRTSPRVGQIVVSYLPDNVSSTNWITWESTNYRLLEKQCLITTLAQQWPRTEQRFGLRVTGIVGYLPVVLNEGDPDYETTLAAARLKIPSDIRKAIQTWAGYMFEHRQGESDAAQIPTDAQTLIEDMPPLVFNLVRNYRSFAKF
jgi:hypothetical protein